MRGLSSSRTETNTVPVRGSRAPPPSWLLAKAISNERSRPITSPVDFISGPSTVSTPAEAGEREHRLLDADVVEAAAGAAGSKLAERLARHDAGRDLGDRQADHLGDERHRARGARIDLQHVDVAVLDGVLHVHQAADLERQRELAGLALELGDGLRA